jgi:hypothetical protein
MRSNDEDVRSLLVRRSVDSGATWQAPQLLSDHAATPQIAGRGKFVDVVWEWGGRLYYARSTNSGASYAAPVVLAPSHARADPYGWYPSAAVARDTNGLVAVAWIETGKWDSVAYGFVSQSLVARVSTDNGASFGPKVRVSGSGGNLKMAVGDGVIYIFYDRDGLRVKRSLDGGASWSVSKRLARNYGDYGVAAEGSAAYVVFDKYPGGSWNELRSKRTDDRGETWTNGGDLLPDGWYSQDIPTHVSLHNGVARVAFEPCFDEWDICGDSGVVGYVESRDGATWSEPQRVSGKWYSNPSGIVVADRIVVLYESYERDGEALYAATHAL